MFIILYYVHKCRVIPEVENTCPQERQHYENPDYGLVYRNHISVNITRNHARFEDFLCVDTQSFI